MRQLLAFLQMYWRGKSFHTCSFPFICSLSLSPHLHPIIHVLLKGIECLAPTDYLAHLQDLFDTNNAHTWPHNNKTNIFGHRSYEVRQISTHSLTIFPMFLHFCRAPSDEKTLDILLFSRGPLLMTFLLTMGTVAVTAAAIAEAMPGGTWLVGMSFFAAAAASCREWPNLCRRKAETCLVRQMNKGYPYNAQRQRHRNTNQSQTRPGQPTERVPFPPSIHHCRTVCIHE